MQLLERELEQVERHHPLQQAGLDDLAAPAALPLEQRRENAVHRPLRGGMRRDRHGGEGRPLALPLPAETEHPPRFRRDRALIARIIGVGPFRPPAGDRAVDEAFVDADERVVISAQARSGTGPEGRDGHIRIRGQLVQAGPAGRIGQVQFDGALAAQPHRRGRQPAPRVPARPLDLDHLRAEIGEHHRGDAADGTR